MPAVAAAGSLEVRVLGRDGAPVPEVAVYAEAADADSGAPAGAAPAAGRETMNQRGLAFDPHVLVVQTGTQIVFPNNDDVRHHVYSFSPANRFDLTIDSGSVHAEPLVFDEPGLVTLGCNIHDNMLAYIRVVDTPHFAKTGGDGIASLAVPAGRYQVHVWTPRLPQKSLPEPVAIEIAASGTSALDFLFGSKLYPPHEHSETSLHWPHY
jgi:plastocyanin